MMGELFSSQIRHYIAGEVLKLPDPRAMSFYGRPEVGAYLREKVFGPGHLYPWNELTQRATGEPLSAKAYARSAFGGTAAPHP
jgi:peptidyl-dipeptidase A